MSEIDSLQSGFEKRLDDTSEVVVHETFDVHVNDDEDDEAYHDLAALGLKVLVVELYRNSKYRSDSPPPKKNYFCIVTDHPIKKRQIQLNTRNELHSTNSLSGTTIVEN
jgi:hypothetical protein